MSPRTHVVKQFGFPTDEQCGVLSRPAVVAELQVMPDVPIALVQLSRPPTTSVLAVTYNQLYAINGWSVNPGTYSHESRVRYQFQ